MTTLLELKPSDVLKMNFADLKQLVFDELHGKVPEEFEDWDLKFLQQYAANYLKSKGIDDEATPEVVAQANADVPPPVSHPHVTEEEKDNPAAALAKMGFRTKDEAINTLEAVRREQEHLANREARLAAENQRLGDEIKRLNGREEYIESRADELMKLKLEVRAEREALAKERQAAFPSE